MLVSIVTTIAIKVVRGHRHTVRKRTGVYGSTHGFIVNVVVDLTTNEVVLYRIDGYVTDKHAVAVIETVTKPANLFRGTHLALIETLTDHLVTENYGNSTQVLFATELTVKIVHRGLIRMFSVPILTNGVRLATNGLEVVVRLPIRSVDRLTLNYRNSSR